MSFGVGVGDLIAVSNLASKVRKQFVDSPDQFQDICQEVKSLSNILRDVEELLPERNLTDGQKTDLQHVTKGCSNVLTALEKVLDKYRELDTSPKRIRDKSRRAWKRLKWEPDDIRDLRLRIVSSIGLLNAFNATIASQFSSETKQGVDELRRHNHDVENQAIIDWLTPIDYSTQQSDFIGRQQKGTGQWLLDSDEFQRWQNDSKQTMFCPGIPGAGKTMITSIVIDHLCETFQNEADIGIAYLYCNYRRKEEQSPDQLLLSLVKQLVQELPSVPDGIKNLYEHHKCKRTRPSFDEILTALHSIVADYSRVFIIIDALDECHGSDGYRQKLLSETFSLQAKTEVNIFATSRFIPEITKKFEGSVFLEIRASDEDVRRYLDGKIPLLRPFVSRSLALQEEIKTEIIKVVEGMFLLAQLHMDSLRDKTTAKLIKLALKRLPKGLEALDIAYKEAVERIEAQDKGLQELAKRTLSWVILAKRPLRTSELQHALAIEIGEPEIDLENLTEVEEIISVCTGLVTVDEESDIIRLVHYTTQEYFERTWESWFPNAQDDITKTCVTYLSFNTFAVGLCTNRNEFKARLDSNPLYYYAAKHWGHHASMASIETKESILHFLERDANLLSCNQARRANNRFSTCYRYDQLQMPGIHFAALYGLIEVMATLLKNGCAAGLTDWEGRTPLFWAALAGRVAAVKWLLAEDGIIPDSTNYGGGAPLTHAANEGDEELVELRFAKGDIDPDPKSLSGQTPLSISAMHGQEAVVKLLLAHGSVDANSKDKYGSTPLFRAAEYGHETVVKLLLTHENVDANSKNNYGSTPLHRAAEYGHEAVVKLLLTHESVDANSKNNYGSTPLHKAAMNGHEAVVKLLLTHESVNANSKDKYGSTPLHRATKSGQVAVVKLLLAYKNVDANSKDKYGSTPLLRAAEYRFEEMVELLLTHKSVDANSKSNYGSTPLLRAAENGHEAVVRLLLEREDVDIDTKDMDDLTPLWRAAKCGHETVVWLLLEHTSVRDNQMMLSTVSESTREKVLKTLESAKRDRDHSEYDSEDSG